MSDDNKTTTQLPKDEIQTGLLNKLVGTVTEIRDGMQKLSADVGLVANDLSVVKDRVALIETRTTTLEQRAETSSMRVKGQSEVDLQHEAQLAQERAAREELAKKVDTIETKAAAIEVKTDAQTAILQRLDSLTKNPAVKLFAHAVLVAFLYWLAQKGIKVQLP